VAPRSIAVMVGRRPAAPVMPAPPSQKPAKPEPPLPTSVTLSEGVTVKELSEKLNRKSKDIIKKLIDFIPRQQYDEMDRTTAKVLRDEPVSKTA